MRSHRRIKKSEFLVALVVAFAAFAGTSAVAMAAGANCVHPLDLVSGYQDLSQCNLNKAAIGDYGLWFSNLTGANLNHATISGYDALANADLTGANLNMATISGFGLYGANVTGAQMNKAIISGSEALYGATGTGTDLHGATLSGFYAAAFAILPGANLNQATISGYDALAGADLTGAQLKQATINGFGLYGANLTGCGPEQRRHQRLRGALRGQPDRCEPSRSHCYRFSCAQRCDL